MNKAKDEILSSNNLATTAALTNVENKIPNVNDLAKKANYDGKISEMEDKCFSTSEYNKFPNNILDTEITQKKLVNEYDLNKKIITFATKEEIKI